MLVILMITIDDEEDDYKDDDDYDNDARSNSNLRWESFNLNHSYDDH